MTYEPSNGLFTRIDRLIRPYQHQRMIKFKLTRPVISFSFDDFPKTAIAHGARCLERYDARGTFYTCAGRAGTTNHHGLHFSAADLKNLEASGHEIAGHTHDHTDCSMLEPSEITAQIEQNKEALTQLGVSSPVTGFAYPYGATRGHLKSVLAEHFHAIRGIKGSVHYGKADLNELYSYGFYGNTFENVMKTIEGLKQRPGFMTLFTHDVSESPTDWGCTPTQFEAAVKLAKQIDAIILPVRDAVAYLERNHDQ